MFKAISWSEYFTGVTCILTAYYAICIGLFYRVAITGIWKQYKNHGIFYGKQQVVVSSTSEPSYNNIDTANAPSFSAGCLSDLDVIIQNAGQQQPSKRELIRSLQDVLQKHDLLKTTEARSFIDEYIIEQTKFYPVVNLSKEELEMIWWE